MDTIGTTCGFGDHDLKVAFCNLLIKRFLSPQPEVSDHLVINFRFVKTEKQPADPVNKPLKYTRVSPTYKLPDKVSVELVIGKLNIFYFSILAPFALSKSNYSADSVPSFLIHH